MYQIWEGAKVLSFYWRPPLWKNMSNYRTYHLTPLIVAMTIQRFWAVNTEKPFNWFAPLPLDFSSSLGIPLEKLIGHLDLFEVRKLFHNQYLKSINITSKTKTRFSPAFHWAQIGTIVASLQRKSNQIKFEMRSEMLNSMQFNCNIFKN